MPAVIKRQALAVIGVRGESTRSRMRCACLVIVVTALTGCSPLSGSTTAQRTADRPPASRDRPSSAPAAKHPGGVAKQPHTGTGAQPIVQTALKYVGVPYRWGGVTPAGFDCSGFVRYVYAKAGVSLPRTAAEQYKSGVPVTRENLQPGDLVFFDRLRHNGIYVGDRRFIHATRTGGHVIVSHLDEPWFKRRWIGGRRIHPTGS